MIVHCYTEMRQPLASSTKVISEHLLCFQKELVEREPVKRQLAIKSGDRYHLL